MQDIYAYCLARISVLLLASFVSVKTWACSCAGLSVCEWMEQPSFELVAIGKLVDYREYPGYAAASYMKVDAVIAGNLDITKTI